MEKELEIVEHVKPVTLLTSQDDVIEDELKHLHKVFCRIEGAWILAETIDDVCKLSLTTVKVLDHRRKVLGLDRVDKSKDIYLTPYDD